MGMDNVATENTINTAPSAPAKVVIRDLFKIFGSDPKMGLQQVRNGVNKTDLLDQHGQVLGLRDINVEMGEGQIICSAAS